MAIRVTIEVAYAWLNTNEGSALRPLLRKFYLHVVETAKAVRIAVEDKQISELTAIAEQLDSTYQGLKKSNGVFIIQGFDKPASQLKIAIANQNVKELDTLCQQMSNAGGSHLASSTSDLILRLMDEIEMRQMQNAWQTIKSLENIALNLADAMESAEILVECGYAAYHLGNNDNAIRYLRQAIKKYNTSRHQIAMAEWMLGWVAWHMVGTRDHGFVALRNSIDKFDFLGDHAAFGREGVEWYRQRCQDMRETLEWLIKSVSSAQPAAVPTPVTAPTPAPAPVAMPEPIQQPQHPVTPQLEAEPEPSPFSLTPEPTMGEFTIAHLPQAQNLLQVLEVVESIPAGGWGPTGHEPYRSDTHVDVPLVLINDVPHVIKSLRGSGTINLLASGQRYMVVKVTGDSMNLDYIDKGDYVLLRRQSDAQDNDIVAVEIHGKDEDEGTHATLKRFVRRNGEIILRPNSTNPKYQEFSMPKLNVGAYIRGVAYAVFKPLNVKAETHQKNVSSKKPRRAKSASTGQP